ncbi:Rrf2 family transcriptional regulator [Vibrio parahaemolyticus]
MLSSRANVAVLLLLELEASTNAGLNSRVTELAKALDISTSYVEQLVCILKANNLVVSSRGPNGGYKLSKSLSNIHLSQIVMIFEKRSDFESAKRNSRWSSFRDGLHLSLTNITLDKISNFDNVSLLPPRVRKAS